MKNKLLCFLALFLCCISYTFAQAPPTITCPASGSFVSNPGTCGGTATFITPVAVDPDTGNSVAVTQTMGAASGSVFPLGNTIIEFSATDVDGTSTCQFIITIVDNQAPIADLATLTDATAECSVDTSTLIPPTATDNCAGTFNGTTPTVTITSQGSTTITWTYNDGNGNTSTQTQNVVITDVTAPTPDVAMLADVTAECEVTSLTAPTATDNCVTSTVTVTNNATLPISGEGTTTVVTWTYNDGNGNTSTQTQNVVIDDVTAPTPDVAMLADVTAECEVTSLTAPTATDNCATSTVTVTNNATLPISGEGTTTVVTWTYNDGNGNTSTQTQNIVIDDVTAPTPDVATLADVTAECEVTSLTAPTATDNCPTAMVTVTNNATLPINAQGTTVVTWTYNDGNGNTSTQTQNVIIDDVTAPTPDVATLADVTAECEVTSLTPPTATDNCPTAMVTVTNNATLPINAQGTTVVTWTYNDGNGNTSTQTQNVIIDDVTAPTPDVATLADVTGQCEVTSLTAPTATDNCATSTVTVTNNATLPISGEGTTTVVTWTYNDGNGNTSTQTQNVVIDDVTGPTPNVATLANVTAQCAVTSLTAPTATDNCPTAMVTVTNDATLPINTQGTTVVTWTYNDGNGNTSTQTQNVVIDDTIAPLLDSLLPASITDECEVAFLPSPNPTDNCGGAITVTNNATLPITTQGTTVVIWTYNDGNGNTSFQSQNVIIDDVTAPTPVVATLADVTAQCAVTSLTAPTATDNCPTAMVTVTNDATLPINAQGTTVVTWTYNDGNGNTSTQTQNVIIDDVTAPTPDVATLADVTGQCEVTSLTAPTATDNCPTATVTVTNNATLPISGEGTTTVVTWTYNDGNGNTSTQTQNVVIDDVTAPTPDVAILADVTAECEVTSLTAPTATDNCSTTVTVTNDATLPISGEGTTTVVTWTYNDGNGNTSTQTQNVIIDDVTAPTPDVATLADVTAECEVTSLTAPTATDNCPTAMVTVTNDATLPINAQGTTVVTWTYNDGNGNTSTQTQNVIIDDVTAPIPNVATLANVTAQCIVTSLTPPAATDNCPTAMVTVTNDATLPINAQGTTVVTWTYNDGNGNTATQTQNVVIDDVTAPTIDVSLPFFINAECEVTVLTSPVPTDNCSSSTIIITNNATLPITTQGSTIITWTYNDGNGNTSTQTQNVVIDDVTAPTPDVAILADVTAECEVTSLTAPTATDNCSATVTVTNDATLPISGEGTTTVVTWTYNDGNGNTSTQTQNVIIDDVTAPTPDVATLADVTAQCAVTSLTAPTATDNCPTAMVTVTNDATLPITSQGTTVVTWTYNDGNGNTSTQTQNVVIDDVTPPAISCPVDRIVFTNPGQCNTVVAFGNAVAIDNCSATVVQTAGLTTGSSFPIGVNTVEFTATDIAGNQTVCSFTITVQDNENPIAVCKNLTVDLDSSGNATITAAQINNGSTDNCTFTLSLDKTTFTCADLGANTVTLTATDSNGNTNTCTSIVTVQDTELPQVICKNLTVQLDATGNASITVADVDNGSTDNCIIASLSLDNTLFTCANLGANTVTLTATDGSGNINTCMATVTVQDMIAPVPDLMSLADVTAQCEVTALTPPTATDNCNPTVIVTNDTTLPINGTTVVTWTYDDGNGNTSTQTQNVVITDVTAPIPDVATLADVNAECEVTALTPPTATDNCGGTVTVTNDATLPINAQGTTVVTWTYADGNANTSTQIQNVVITDVTAPTPDVAMLADVTAECEVTSLTAPTATDNCATSTVTVTNDAILPISGEGTTTLVTWTYDDGNGNTSTQTQNVLINDVTGPTPSLVNLADVVAQCSVTSLTPPTATDNCSSTVTVTNNVTLPITGNNTTTIVTWTYNDGNGNTTTQTQNVVIKDTTAPTPNVATLANVTAQCIVTSLTAPTATDNCGGAVTVTNNASLPISGNTTITWTYNDGKGNTSTQTQNVVITDSTAPVANLATLPDVTNECSVNTSALTAPTATDNCAGSVTGTTPAITISTQGTTVITWTYADGNGNSSTQTQNVVIDDITGPTPNVATLANVTAQCIVTSLTAPTATDNCSGTVTVTNNATLPITGQGTTVVTWTYNDGNGNTSTQTQNVVIDDITGPTPVIANLSPINTQCEVTSLTAPTATDNCSGTVTVTNNATLPINTQGLTVVTWTYADGNGNTTTQTQNVVIDDVTAPTPNVATLANVTAQCIVTSLTAPSATDNCSGTVTVTNNATLPITSQGTTVVTWTYNDGNGNTTTQTQNVVIDDVTAPTPNVATLANVTAQCIVTSLTAPSATDNCSGTVTVTNNATLPITSQGTTVVTWTYNDGNGNTSTQTQNVVINDTTAPVLSGCPIDFNVAPDSSGNYTILDYSTILTFSDNCTPTVNLITSQSPAAGTVVTDGTINTVTFTVTDAAGNTSIVCSFDITVDPLLSVKEYVFSDSQVALYPNPSSEFIYINTNNIILESASILDLRGRIIKTINFNQAQEEYKIDVSSLENAYYFVRLSSEKGSVVKRFIKN